MLYREAVSKRILELCETNNITVNHLAEISAIPPVTLHDLVSCKVKNPSSYVIYLVSKQLKMKLKDFYDSPLFDYNNITD